MPHVIAGRIKYASIDDDIVIQTYTGTVYHTH